VTTVEPFDPLAATDADAVALHAVRAAAEAVDYPPDRPAGTVAQMRVGLADTSGSLGDTAVVPEHRGRGFGLWVKADMLVRLRTERPDVTALLTGNSSTNAHMLRINDRLGYRPWTELHSWQGDAAALAGRLGLRPRRDVPAG
jgi:GNAT superfamily N-acetyltransferase